MPIPGLGMSCGPFDRGQGGAITSVEAFALSVMAAVLVAIAVPSYITMRGRENDSAARAQLRQASEAADVYRAARGSYVGMSPSALSRLDGEVEASGYRVVTARRTTYCLEATAGGRTWHFAAPSHDLSRGGCP